MPRRRVRTVSVRCWNNCISEYSPFPFPNSHTKTDSPQSSNGSSSGGTDTAFLLSSDLRLSQPPVIDLICTSPDSGVVHDDFNPLSSTLYGHSVASSFLDHSPLPHKQFNHTLFLLMKIKVCAHQSILPHSLWRIF